MESVERDILLPAPPDEAWRLVCDLGDWFASDITGEIALGEVVRTDGRRAVVERVDPPHRLTFRYLGEDPSRVDITLEGTPDGTLVRVTETRIEPAVTPKPEIGFAKL
jgi:uncharacterized protein YndB with AHSA1/START domain